MKRRNFLKGMAALAAVPAIPVLATPAEPKLLQGEIGRIEGIKIRETTGNRALTPSEITREAINLLADKLDKHVLTVRKPL